MIIENRRWDPVTGTSSAFAGIVTDLVKNTGDLVFKPYQEYQRGGDDSLPLIAAQPASSATIRCSSITNNTMYEQETDSSSTTSNQHRTGFQTTGAVACQAMKGLGTLLGHYSKGLMVDLPLAATECLRAVPRLYGDEVRDYGPVRGWKSGAIVGGKTFAHGMAQGLSGIVTRPYQGAKEDGAAGAMKGLAKGTLEFTTKVSSGWIYPLLNPEWKEMNANIDNSGIGAGGISQPRYQ
jgi:hypothetical protein